MPTRVRPARPTLDVAMNLTEVATSGPVLLAVLLSVAAGAVSFASPCVVPLVPGYLAYLAGLVGADAPAVTEDEVQAQDAERRAAVTGELPVATATPRRPRRWRVAGAAVPVRARLHGRLRRRPRARSSGWPTRCWPTRRSCSGSAGSSRRAWAWCSSGWCPALQRDTRPHRVPQRRPGRRAAARRDVRPGLDAVPRADARRGRGPGQRHRLRRRAGAGPRAAARLLRRARRAVPAHRPRRRARGAGARRGCGGTAARSRSSAVSR